MTEPSVSRSHRDAVAEERLEILRLLEAGTVTAEEASRLLDALDRGNQSPGPRDAPTGPIGMRARQVRVRITETDSGRATLNLALPLGLIDAGLGIARRFAPDRMLDAETIREAMTTGFRGSLLDVDDGDERVEILVE
ncbi:MAG: DUF2089 domain-containing protein [Chloroflexota bacterium]|nr:DUF2089 domain-containing protein [Chloroflexota bacterium]